MQSSTEPSRRSGAIADYLADREGLEGAARRLFVRQLREVFGFRAAGPRWIASMLIALAVVLAGFGLMFEARSERGMSAALPWFGMAGLGAALGLIVARDGGQARLLDRESEWRAYCLLVRPLILRSRPGLLDRNLRADASASDAIVVSQSGSAIAAAGRGPAASWLPAGAGWAVGSIAAIAWRVAAGPAVWLGGLSLCGALLGPPLWAMIRLRVFRRVHRAARDEH